MTLTTAAPRVATAEAESIAAEHYGIVGTATRLAGEKDDNFVIRAEHGDHVLKVVHPAEPYEVTEFLSAVLRAVGPVPGLSVQRVVPSKEGCDHPLLATRSGLRRRVRLTTYLEGRMLKAVPSTPALRENLGRALARLGHELRNFTHPRAVRPVLWDLRQAGQLWPLLRDLEGRIECDEILACLERFDADTHPRLEQLRRQILHSDLSGDNVLIAEDGVTVVGIIDFGDAVETQLINDIAIAATNMLDDSDDPIAPALDLVWGYHGVEPLTAAELELLYDLIRLRTVARIIISEWRALQYPENREYIVRNTAWAWRVLEKLSASAEAEVTERITRACGLH